MKIKWRNQHDGYLVEDDDDIARDGEIVHTPMMMFDSAAGRPGFAQLTDEMIAKRAQARDSWIKQMSDAWRGSKSERITDIRRPPADEDEDEDDDDDGNDNGRGGARPRRRNSEDAQVAARKAATRSYHQMVRRLEDAWRRPVGSVRANGEPDMSSSAETMRHHLRTEPDENAQARRDAAWAQYRDQLGNAWKTNPSAATAIERQGERWRGGR
jgi:hypothetical protein